MIDVIVGNLINVGKVMILLALSWICDSLFGMYANMALKGQAWDREKFLKSVLKLIVLIVGIAVMVTTVSAIPVVAIEVGFTIPDEYIEVISTLAIITAVFTVTLKYLADAFKKFAAILGYKKAEAINLDVLAPEVFVESEEVAE